MKNYAVGIELLGIQDIARLFGWSRQRVWNYYKREQMPEPYALVGGKRPVWTREQIEEWVEKRNARKSGRVGAEVSE